jgi:membrane protease YdiL (CAAX protease family)
MAAGSKSLIPEILPDRRLGSAQTENSRHCPFVCPARSLPVGLVFGLIMVVVWTRQGSVNAITSLLAALCIVWFTIRDRYSVRELGLARPISGALVILVCGACMVGTIAVAGSLIQNLGPAQPVPWRRAWQYAIWSVEQEFILQSFFFVRLESALGSRRAVWAAALLFSAAHLPSPVLTLLSFIGGLVFCELFRRYRNILPLGLVHATLGLTIAASFPDSLLHHMRVGLGYFLYRS